MTDPTTRSREKKEVQFTALPLMAHQRAALRKAWGRKYFAYLMEQGTGKTLTYLAEALALYARGKIDALVAVAPNGVHENWALDEVPKSIPDNVPYVCAYYSTNLTRKEKRALDELMQPRAVGEVVPLRILTVSYDSLCLERGFKFVESFMRATKPMLVIDESHKIKSHNKQRAKRVMNLRRWADIRRIGTGTAIANSPMDAFSQFEFLEHGLLGETSFPAFKARYAELLPHGHGLLRRILDKVERKKGRQLSESEREALTPQLIAHDEMGRPKYRNLDQLHAYIAEHSYRVLKADCLDLPEKVYETRFFHLSAAQRVVYDRMAEELRYILEDGTVLTASKLVALGKLRQITSGFLLLRDGSVSYVEDNPRIELLHSELEDEDTPGIIWSQFKEEQRNIARMLREMGRTVEVVNGDTPMKRRREIREEFQAGNLQWIDAHPGAMGTGYTLTRGELVYYYSNGFNLVDRIQSEDRTHRKGTTGTVVYRDFIAIDTKDDDVVWALQHKLDIAAIINGDPQRRDRFRANTTTVDAGQLRPPKANRR